MFISSSGHGRQSGEYPPLNCPFWNYEITGAGSCENSCPYCRSSVKSCTFSSQYMNTINKAAIILIYRLHQIYMLERKVYFRIRLAICLGIVLFSLIVFLFTKFKHDIYLCSFFCFIPKIQSFKANEKFSGASLCNA